MLLPLLLPPTSSYPVWAKEARLGPCFCCCCPKCNMSLLMFTLKLQLLSRFVFLNTHFFDSTFREARAAPPKRRRRRTTTQILLDCNVTRLFLAYLPPLVWCFLLPLRLLGGAAFLPPHHIWWCCFFLLLLVVVLPSSPFLVWCCFPLLSLSLCRTPASFCRC